MQEATYNHEFAHVQLGHCAIVEVVRHPSCRPGPVRTSTVLEHDAETGVFITHNTRYTPHEGAAQ